MPGIIPGVTPEGPVEVLRLRAELALYRQFAAHVRAELAEAGAITKDEVRIVLETLDHGLKVLRT